MNVERLRRAVRSSLNMRAALFASVLLTCAAPKPVARPVEVRVEPVVAAPVDAGVVALEVGPPLVVSVVDAVSGKPVVGARVSIESAPEGTSDGCSADAQQLRDGEQSSDTNEAGEVSFQRLPRQGGCKPGQPCAERRLTTLVQVSKSGYVTVETLGVTSIRLVPREKWAVKTSADAIARALRDRRLTKVRSDPNLRACFGGDGLWWVFTQGVASTVHSISGKVALISCSLDECTGFKPPPEEPFEASPAERCLRTRKSFQLVCGGSIEAGQPDRIPAIACDTCLVDKDCPRGDRCVDVGLVACHGPKRRECRTPSPECGGKICPERVELVP